MHAQAGCFAVAAEVPGVRFLVPGYTGAESAHSAADWGEAFGAVLSEAGSLDRASDAEQYPCQEGSIRSGAGETRRTDV